METAESILELIRWWGMAGVLVACVFLGYGIDRIDEDARGAYVFRVLLVPAILILWPLVLWRWWVLETNRDVWALRHRPPRRAHAVAALIMVVVIPAIFVAALSLRQTWPSGYEPQRLGAVEPTQ